MNYSEPNYIYEKSTDNESYHGGYGIDSYIEYNTNNKYLGGNRKNTAMFQDMVVPFGLFYGQQSTMTKKEEEEKYIDGGLISESMFDKLLLSVGKIEKPRGKQKTRKNNSSKT
jgi:hypothetical protein